MPKIMHFTISEFLEKEEEYLNMTEAIELRANEIANNLNKFHMPWVIDHVDFVEENSTVMARAFFYNMFRPDDIEVFEFNANWLFNDEYLKLLPPEDLRRKRFEVDFEKFMKLRANSQNNN